MATPFRLKRSAIEGKRPAQADLQLGELALNTYDGYLYTEREGVGLATVTNLTPWYENYGGGSIYYSNSVGIGTTVPQYNLDVRKGSIGGYDTLIAQHSDVVKEISVVVASKTNDHRYQGQGSGNAYVLDGIQAPVLTLTPGRTYKFNLSSSDMSSHPFRFYLDEGKTVQYTTNVTTTATSAQITITDDTPNILHYQCSSHGYMGNALIINSNVINTPYAAIIRNGLDVLSGNVDISSNLNVTGNLDVDGNTTLDVTTIDGLLDINAGGQANTFKVEDLTSGRIVTVGTGGELQDSGNLLFNGTDLSASSLIVSDLTDGRVVLAGGSGAVEDNANLKFNTTTSEFEVVGHTVLDTVATSGIATIGSVLYVGGTAGGTIQISNNDFLIDAPSGDEIFLRANGGDRVLAGRVNAETELFYNNNLKLATKNTGINVTGEVTASGNINGVNGNFSGDLTVTGNVGIAGTLTYEDVSRVDAVGLSTFREGLFIPDSQKAQFGNAAGSADLEIYHDGSHSYIHDGGTGNLKVRSNNFRVSNADESKVSATFVPSGAVELYHNNSHKFSTGASGITVNGSVSASGGLITGVDNAFVYLGAGNDLQLTHNGTDSYIRHATGSGQLQLRSREIKFMKSDATGIMAKFVQDAQAELHFNNNLKLETNNTGVVVTGIVSATSFTGSLTGTASLATDLAINGTNQIVYQDSNNDSDVLPTGSAGQILASSGAGAAPQWVNSAPAGAIEGITIRDESTIVGTANSISTINFLGDGVVADAAAGAGIATVTISAITGLGVSMGGGSVGTAVTGIDFEGSLVSVDAVTNTGIATVRVEGLSVKDEGSLVGTAGSITTINFVGAGIAAAVSGGTATVTASGGATTDDVVALAIALG